MSAAEKMMAALPDVIRWGDESSEPVGLERAYVDLVAAVARLDSSLKDLEHRLSPLTLSGPSRVDSSPEERKPASAVTEAIAAQARWVESLFRDVEDLRLRLEV